MRDFVDLVLSYLINSVWQAPVLLLTGLVAARLIRRAGPSAEHRVWVAMLLSQALLPAASLMPWERLHIAWPWHGNPAALSQAGVAVQMGAGTGLGRLLLPSAVMTCAAILYGSTIVYFAARFAWRCSRLALLARTTRPLQMAEHDVPANQSRTGRMKIAPVVLCSSAQIFAPLTMGFVRKRIVLPESMLSGLAQADIDTAIAHELAHVKRDDFVKNLLYELLSLPVSYHPAFWLVRQRMTETREMACDAMAARVAGSHPYAQSLLRLASLLLEGKPLGVPHAMGVFEANTLERRLMKLTETRKPAGRLRRWAACGACVVLGVAAASSLIALRFDVAWAAADKVTATGPTFVSPEEIVGYVLTKVPPKYPPDAKKAGIQGKVALETIIGKSGHVENLKVVSGPAKLQQSALDAVSQWTFRPFFKDGAPVEVKTTINVIYRLAK